MAKSPHRRDQNPSDAPKALPSPQLARAQQATENVWHRLEAEFGLLTGSEVAELLGASPSRRAFAETKRAENEVIGALRGGEFRYPGFQFDHGVVLPVIAPLIVLARANHWRDEDLIFWLQGPSTSFEEEDRPVDHLRSDPDAVLAAAKNAFTAEW
jgi:hypothetical protein